MLETVIKTRFLLTSVMGVVLLATSVGLSAAPIHSAVIKSDLPGVRALLAKDPAQAMAAIRGGVTALHIAAGVNSADIAKLLLDNGAKINATTANGATPLHWAAMKNAVATAHLLVSRGADVNAKTADGLTPLDVAIAKDYKPAINVLASPADRALFIDPDFVAGQESYAHGKYADAFNVLSRLLRKYPDNIHLNAAVAGAATAVAEHPHALAAYQRILARNPDNDRVRLDMARSYLSMEQLDIAEDEFKTVLERTAHPIVRANIIKHLDMIAHERRGMVFHGQVSAGATYDNNVNVGPNSSVISVTPIAVTVENSVIFQTDTLDVGEQSLPSSDSGGMLSATLAAFRDVGDKGGWSLTGGGTYYQTLLSESPDYETLYVGIDAGVRRYGKQSLFALPLKVKHIRKGHAELVTMYGVSPSWLYVLGKGGRWNISAAGAAEYRAYAELTDRDGPFASGSASFKRFGKRRTRSIDAGVSYFHEFTDAKAYENDGIEAHITITAALPLKLLASAKAKYRIADYKEALPLQSGPRSDEQQQYTLALTKKLSRHFGIAANVQLTDNNSSFGLYEYDRLTATCSTSYSF